MSGQERHHKNTRDGLEVAIRSIYDQEILDMLGSLAKKYREGKPIHNQDPGGKLRNRSRLQWDGARRLKQEGIARRLQSPGGGFRKKP